MQNSASNTRVYVTLIICVGLVVSVWLVNRSVNIKPAGNKNSNNSVVSIDYLPSTSADQADVWAKQLNTVQGDLKVTDLTKSNENVSDDTTITNHMTIDIMSRYLALKSGGQEVTQAQMDKIISDVMADPAYSNTLAPTYVSINLKIIEKNDYNTVKSYKDKVNVSIMKALTQASVDPSTIIEQGIKSGREDDLKKLDPYIVANTIVIKELLAITVPREAVSLHLRLLNSFSNTLTDLEAIRSFASDPVRSFPAVSQFNKHVRELLDSINAMGQYKPK